MSTTTSIISGAGLLIIVLGIVWRISSLVSRLEKVDRHLGKLHEEFERYRDELNEMRTALAVMKERMRAGSSSPPVGDRDSRTTPPRGIRRPRIDTEPPDDNGDKE